MGAIATVLSPVGGSGKTFLAVNRAWFLHRRVGARTCLVDLDLHGGGVAAALSMAPRSSIVGLLGAVEDPAHLSEVVDDHLETHESGIHVLAAPRRQAEGDRVIAADVAAVLTAVCARFDHVVVDTPRALSEPVLAAVTRSDAVQVVVTPEPAGMRGATVLLAILDRLGIPPEHRQVVLNKARRASGAGRSDAPGVDAVVPSGREVNRALHLGRPVLASAPDAEVAHAVAGAFAHLTPPGLGRPAGPHHGPTPLPRLRRRSTEPEHA